VSVFIVGVAEDVVVPLLFVTLLFVSVWVSVSPTMVPEGAVTADTTPEAIFAIPVSPVGIVTVPVKVGEARGAFAANAAVVGISYPVSRAMANVPELVIGEPDTVNPVGTV